MSWFGTGNLNKATEGWSLGTVPGKFTLTDIVTVTCSIAWTYCWIDNSGYFKQFIWDFYFSKARKHENQKYVREATKGYC